MTVRRTFASVADVTEPCPADRDQSARAGRPAWHPALLSALLFLVLHAWSLGWGLPSFTGWAGDELLPGDVVRAVEAGFTGGWHERYPPLHYRLLGLVDGLILRLDQVPARNPLPEAVHTELALAGRLVSLLMGAGATALVALCAGRLYGERAGLLAALVFTGMPTLGFHARLATLDVPYLFWWALSLWFALRALERSGWRDALGFGLAAGLAVTTKDQAYGLYFLAWPTWLWLLRRRGALDAGRLLAPLALALLVFALAHGLPGDLPGFLAHVELVLGPASQPYQAFSRDLPGLLGLLRATLRLLGATLGWPALLLGLAGVAGAVARRGRRPEELLLLATGASYVLTFLLPICYVYDRFVLPLALLLAVFGAGLWARWLASPRPAGRRLAWALAAGLALLSTARALETGLYLSRDTRYVAERWLAEHTPPGARVGFVGAWKHLPRAAGLHVRSLRPDEAELRRMQPRLVVFNVDAANANRARDASGDFLDWLASGHAGYALVWRSRQPAPWPLSADLAALEGDGSLSAADPEIAIFARLEPRETAGPPGGP